MEKFESEVEFGVLEGSCNLGLGLTYLPVFSITLQHHWILRLADFAHVVVLDFLHIVLCLDALVLRERTLMTLLYRGHER